MGELCVIAGLSSWLYATYLNDVYFQSYTNGYAPALIPLLSVAFGVCSASLAAYLYLGMKKIRAPKETEVHLQKKPKLQRKAAKRLPASEILSETKKVETAQIAHVKLRPLTPDHSNNKVHRTPSPRETTEAPPKNETDRKSSNHD